MSNHDELKTIENLQRQIEAMQKRIAELQKQALEREKTAAPVKKALPAIKKPAAQAEPMTLVLINKLKEKIGALRDRLKEKRGQLKKVKAAEPAPKPQKKKAPPKEIKPKLSLAIVSLTCCEGCQVAIMDLGERFLQLSQKIKIGDFAFLEDQPEPATYDIVFVEGAPITEENLARLKNLRARAKTLIALGACAALGGIAELKNYQDKDEHLRYVYKNFEGINNPDIKPLSHYVKVDFEIPGCPINKEEFLKITQQIIAGIPPKIQPQPVCHECQIKQNKCLLQAGLPCLGPVILGGCGAPCPSSAYPCDGCRGPLKNVNPDKLNKQLIKQGYSQREIDLITQRFGMEDAIYPEPPTLKR